MTVEAPRAKLRETFIAENLPEVDWRAVGCLVDKTLNRLFSEGHPNQTAAL